MTAGRAEAWRWVGSPVALAIHDWQIAEHGGLRGMRDPGAVESALARPQNLVAYGEPDPAALAAAYAYRLIRNNGLSDGDKRTAWIVARVFLADNGHRLRFDMAGAIGTVEAVAGGALLEEKLAAWCRNRAWCPQADGGQRSTPPSKPIRTRPPTGPVVP